MYPPCPQDIDTFWTLSNTLIISSSIFVKATHSPELRHTSSELAVSIFTHRRTWHARATTMLQTHLIIGQSALQRRAGLAHATACASARVVCFFTRHHAARMEDVEQEYRDEHDAGVENVLEDFVVGDG